MSVRDTHAPSLLDEVVAAIERPSQLSVEELDTRIAVLETEILRVRTARDRKLSGRAAADALFSRRPD